MSRSPDLLWKSGSAHGDFSITGDHAVLLSGLLMFSFPLFLDLSPSASQYYSLRMAKLTDVFVTFHADFSNVPDIPTGLKRSQTDGTLDQVSHREKKEQTFRVRCYPVSAQGLAGKPLFPPSPGAKKMRYPNPAGLSRS